MILNYHITHRHDISLNCLSYCVIKDVSLAHRFVSLIVLRHKLLTLKFHIDLKLNNNMWHILGVTRLIFYTKSMKIDLPGKIFPTNEMNENTS